MGSSGNATRRSARARASADTPAPSLPTTRPSREGAGAPPSGVPAASATQSASAERRAERVDVLPGSGHARMVEEGAHRTANDFGVPEIDRTRQGDGGRSAERGRGPEDRPHVAGILHGVEHEQAETVGRFHAVERALRNGRDGDHALRGVGLGGGVEVARRHLLHGAPRPADRLAEGGAAWRLEQLRRHQYAGGSDRRAKQFLHRAHALAHEQVPRFAGFPAPQVSCEGEESQGCVGWSGEVGRRRTTVGRSSRENDCVGAAPPPVRAPPRRPRSMFRMPPPRAPWSRSRRGELLEFQKGRRQDS